MLAYWRSVPIPVIRLGRQNLQLVSFYALVGMLIGNLYTNAMLGARTSNALCSFRRQLLLGSAVSGVGTVATAGAYDDEVRAYRPWWRSRSRRSSKLR